MARFPLPPFTKGLNTLLDTAAGDPQASPNLSDVRGHTGILTLRKGFRVLAKEPSQGSVRNYLNFDGSGDRAYHSTWPQTLGTKWTLRWEVEWLITGNDTDGTRTMIATGASAANTIPFQIYLVGVTSGSTIAMWAEAYDSGMHGATLASTARTIAAWQALYPGNTHRYIRLTRDGDNLYLYIGETLAASGTFSGFMGIEAEPAQSLTIGGTGTAAAMKAYGSLTIVNRVLTEAECYWGINYPTDNSIDNGILGNWLFNESTGTTVTDYSPYKYNLTVSNATWVAGSNASARGLGIFSWRRSNGDIYHTLACGRRGPSGAAAAPSGALYTWKTTKNFTPFYFGGVSSASNSTAGLDGLDPFAPASFAQGKDMLIWANGVDYCRKYQAAYKYLGGTAPPTAPVLATTGTGLTGAYTYAYSYYNPVEGTETGLSPSASITLTNQSATVTVFHSSDSQFTKVRIYRGQAGDPTLYLVTEIATGAGAYTDAKTDTDLRAGPLCAGSDVAGNRSRKRAYLAFPDFPSNPTLYFSPRGNTARTFPPGSSRGPGTAPSVADGAAGSVDVGTHYWAYSYYDSTNDVETGMSPATGFASAGAKIAAITNLVLPPEGSRYDKMRLYRTKAGATIWYLAQTFTAATSVNESQADSALSTTIETRALPPRFHGVCVFANRLWGFDGPTLYWSTAGSFEDHPESNGFAPKSGVDITAICATNGALFVHFKDGTIHLLPHPGDEPDLSFFVPLNLKQWSPLGAAVGHFSIQSVPGGVIWLAKDGFYLADETTLTSISSQLGPTFLNLNVARAPYACSIYDSSRRIYRCWLSRGNNRLNEECFVYYLDDGSWWLDSIHADAAGVLYDTTENPHYCFLVENGILMELDETLDYDGDGTGTLSGSVSGAGVNHFTEIGSYTAPTGGDGGYPVWLLKSDGTLVQRFRVDNALAASAVTFYPSYSGITSGSWAAYYHGIRGYFKTMLLHLGDLRKAKNITGLFFFNRVESAGGMQVNLAADEGTLTSANADVDLTKPVSQVTVPNGSGRVYQLEIYSDPPAASRPWGLKGLEFEADVDDGDAGT